MFENCSAVVVRLVQDVVTIIRNFIGKRDHEKNIPRIFMAVLVKSEFVHDAPKGDGQTRHNPRSAHQRRSAVDVSLPLA